MKDFFKIIDVLGIKVDDLTQADAVEEISRWLQKDQQKYIVTPNAEIIVAAQTDPDLKKILNEADLATPDGVGLRLAGIKNKVTGIDLMLNLVELATQKGYTIGLIGGKAGVAKKAAKVLQSQYPSLKVSFAEDGGEVNSDGKGIEYRVESIKQKTKLHDTLYTIPATDMLFVAFGHGKQEKWIARFLPKIKVKVAMAVGGSLDYISGEVPRAPKLLRDSGLEWLYRLIIQPWRVKRQRALLQFIWLVLIEKIR